MPPRPSHLLRDALSALVGWTCAQIWTRLTSRTSLTPRHTRKLTHTTTAPLFLLTWPLYSSSALARLLAAAVPLSFSLRVALSPQTSTLARASARTADTPTQRECIALAAYGFAVACLTACGWREDPATYVAVSALAFGDGAAEIVGAAVKSPQVPGVCRWGRRKTVAGTVAFVGATVVGSVAMLKAAAVAGFAVGRVRVGQIGKVAAVAGAVELAPFEDNFTVPLVAFLAARSWL